ncbi:pgsA [Lepeophtheirus salmonis]|uniref:CDP-diacylglycerol--glycerol-3-phosphate 3-phosphatidyltransferase n=1 Tax=Lepeophtheirus salmonis TaxID=72036 RepID=A0A7R8CBR1_LEPSM|nr:pgsA [Lepeophtheirus salmonis]CAF2763456.1 pgsA [Lepeophtheirus salmonis]
MNEVRAVGTRVEDLKGFRGSIRYVGSVGSTQGEWLGIEWDDASRGKHNGTHNGIHYFEAAPLGGSFVRVSKIKSGKGIREAVEDRYGSKHADEEFRPEDILEIQRGMKASLFEIVGMDKVRQAQKDYGKLNVISLRNMCVQFIDGDLKDFMPNVMSLDLGENLLHSWDEVFYIIKDLSHLKYLCVSENRLLTPRKSLPLPSLKEVRLKGNELRGVLPSFQPMNRRLSPRQTTIAMLGRITILNGTEIDRQERIGAEIDYWKMFGLDYIEAKKKDTSFFKPSSSLRGDCSNAWKRIRNKKVPLTMTIKALKILSKKLFKAPNLKDMELSYTTEKSKDVSIPLDDDMREISYFGVINETAKSRIVLSALYLGTGGKERELLGSFLNNPFKPRTRILLDFFRGTRLNSDNVSSCSFLSPLLEYSSKTRVSLYQTPLLRGFLKQLSPQRYNETIGLQHIKVYVFDNSVIISGANLSDDYFTNRQDRYIIIDDCEELADFFEELIDIIADFSYEMKSNNRLEWSGRTTNIEDNRDLYMSEFKERMNDFLSVKRICNEEFDTYSNEWFRCRLHELWNWLLQF